MICEKFGGGFCLVRKAIVTLLVIAGLFGGWLLWCRAWYHSVEPAGQTLADHLAQRPASYRRQVMIARGQEYLVLFGPIWVLPKPPSGPPM